LAVGQLWWNSRSLGAYILADISFQQARESTDANAFSSAVATNATTLVYTSLVPKEFIDGVRQSPIRLKETKDPHAESFIWVVARDKLAEIVPLVNASIEKRMQSKIAQEQQRRLPVHESSHNGASFHFLPHYRLLHQNR